MTTITKERIELFIKSPLENGLTRGEQMELARIALASLEAEPVAYIFRHPAGELFWSLTDESNKDQNDVMPVYAAPPVPVVPEEITDESTEQRLMGRRWAHSFCAGWNACRAAMLQSKYRDLSQPVDPQISEYEKIMLQAGNSPVIPDGYALVPVEPTDEMIEAAMNCEDVLFNSDESFCVQFGNIYEAMLTAAPHPEANNE
ncbi:hypothetical protein QJE18_002923 [Salmonella enterica]|nr:hypothetical protein [Salmonella enterica]